MTASESNHVLARWNFTTVEDAKSVIVPDGCRDLIMHTNCTGRLHWFLTDYDHQPREVSINAETVFQGFRLQPGTRIDEKNLLSALSTSHFDVNEVNQLLASFTVRSESTKEALAQLACNVKSIAQAARELGVSTRTLQRLLLRETFKSPSHWMMLARVRKAARLLSSAWPLVDIAEICGYADQAHMSREMKRWFHYGPTALRKHPAILLRIHNKGYDADTDVHNSINTPLMSVT